MQGRGKQINNLSPKALVYNDHVYITMNEPREKTSTNIDSINVVNCNSKIFESKNLK